MRAVVQRVSRASVSVDGKIAAAIDLGLLILLGVEQGDIETDASYLAGKVAGLRIFPDDDDKMNRSLADVNGQALVVSQFTLLGDCRKGRRPSFIDAANPELGNMLYERFCMLLREQGIEVGQGVFRANMSVELVNDGPVTILLDSRKRF